jgi:hypothetical protein
MECDLTLLERISAQEATLPDVGRAVPESGELDHWGELDDAELRRRIELLAGGFGRPPEAAGPFRWKLLLALMRRALTRELAPFGLKGTAPLVEDRIRRLLATDDDIRPRLTDERMWYDCLVLFGRRLPLGIYHAEVGAVPRSHLVRSAPADAWRLARYLALEMRGFGPTLAIHLPKQMDRPLTERDYVEAHLLAVRLFESNPRLKGFYNAAWYYDPAIASISPHLAFLPRFASSHGAIALSIGQSEDVVADATWKSAARRRLYQAGEYSPKSFARIWSRRRFLEWAHEHRGAS